MPDKTPLHLVWDWNGTVLDDFAVIMRSTNDSFRDAGLPEITAERYRSTICLPIRAFYGRILEREPSDEEWEFLDHAFHTYYVQYEKDAGLSAGLPNLFEDWAGTGRTQSLLSMYHDEKLVPVVEHHGLTRYFALVQGTTMPRPERKGVHLADHLERLGIDGSRTVLIGDSPDDAHAAEHVGARAVLYAGGFAARASLAETGAPIADTLQEAIELIERM
jgi:phosphoglycolate phosphatase-like HAD superfamily hydrolase